MTSILRVSPAVLRSVCIPNSRKAFRGLFLSWPTNGSWSFHSASGNLIICKLRWFPDQPSTPRMEPHAKIELPQTLSWPGGAVLIVLSAVAIFGIQLDADGQYRPGPARPGRPRREGWQARSGRAAYVSHAIWNWNPKTTEQRARLGRILASETMAEFTQVARAGPSSYSKRCSSRNRCGTTCGSSWSVWPWTCNDCSWPGEHPRRAAEGRPEHRRSEASPGHVGGKRQSRSYPRAAERHTRRGGGPSPCAAARQLCALGPRCSGRLERAADRNKTDCPGADKVMNALLEPKENQKNYKSLAGQGWQYHKQHLTSEALGTRPDILEDVETAPETRAQGSRTAAGDGRGRTAAQGSTRPQRPEGLEGSAARPRAGDAHLQKGKELFQKDARFYPRTGLAGTPAGRGADDDPRHDPDHPARWLQVHCGPREIRPALDPRQRPARWQQRRYGPVRAEMDEARRAIAEMAQGHRNTGLGRLSQCRASTCSRATGPRPSSCWSRTRVLPGASAELARQTELYLAQCYGQLNDPAALASSLDRAVDLDPGSLTVRLSRAAARVSQGLTWTMPSATIAKAAAMNGHAPVSCRIGVGPRA